MTSLQLSTCGRGLPMPPPTSPRRTPLTNTFDCPEDLKSYTPTRASRPTSTGDLSPLQLELRKARMRHYEAAEKFAEASREINCIRELVSAKDPNIDEELNNGLADVMSLLIFGLNSIEQVCPAKRETLKLCEEVFVGHRTQLDTIPPRTTEYK